MHLVLVSNSRLASSVSSRWCTVTSAVTGNPSALARLTSATEPAVDRCAAWYRAPVSPARIRSRASITSSADEGWAASPVQAELIPSCIAARRLSESSSQWLMTGRPKVDAYSRARRMIPALAMGCPSSLTATAPASRSSAISVRALPSNPRVTAATGCTRAVPASAARCRMRSVTARLSLGGTVLGMQHTAVNPPATAAAAPDRMSSLYSSPGSRRCTWMSTSPGVATSPLASSSGKSPAGLFTSPTAATRPSSSSRSPS